MALVIISNELINDKLYFSILNSVFNIEETKIVPIGIDDYVDSKVVRINYKENSSKSIYDIFFSTEKMKDLPKEDDFVDITCKSDNKMMSHFTWSYF